MKKIYTTLLLTTSLIFSQQVKSQVLDTVVGFIAWQSPANTADLGIAGNVSTSAISSPNASFLAVTDADNSGQRAVAGGWSGGANTKWWQTSFTTLKYSQLKYSCKMAGTNQSSFLGPRDFKLQYSLNGTVWTDVAGGTIQASTNIAIGNFASLNDVPLPTACNNQSIVYIRMLMTSNIGVTGATVNSGQSHLDDIKVVGYSIAEAPSDITLSSKTFLVNAAGATVPSGTILGNLGSVDFNKGNTFIYSLATGTGSTDNSSFTVNGNSIYTAANLPAGNYSIRVRSTDNSLLYFDKVFTVIVTAPDPITDGTRQRISSMGTTLGTTSFIANSPVNIAYNSTNNEYLSVWSGDDDHAPLVDNEVEIFGQRINAATNAATGGMIRISFMGPNGTATHRATNPAVTYNSTNNEYFVVWQAYHNSGSLAATEDEIWGQRVNALTGALVGAMVRISFMGTDGITTTAAQNPDVSWNSVNNQYLVVWRGDEIGGGLVDNEYEVFGQLVDNLASLSGTRRRISFMGPDGNNAYQAATPAVSYSATSNNFLVIWRSDDNTGGLIDNDNEVFGQIVTNTNTLSGTRVRISTMGPDGVITYGAGLAPDVAWNSTTNEFFVVWSADNNTGSLVDNETEIYGQLVTAAGALTGTRTRLSDMGPDGNLSFAATYPKLTYVASLNEYWVAWQGDDDLTSIDNENEIFLQRVNSLGAEVGTNDIRISYMGPLNDGAYDASQPAIVFNSTSGKAYLVWQADDNTAQLIDNEYQIFGQSLAQDEDLPVTWLSFTGEMQAKHVLLDWKTASEWNTKEFTIQRSANALYWDSIGTKVAATNSNATKQYQFLDYTPINGNNYYRLLQKDQDGRYSYSKVILLKNQDEPKFAVFPNPTAQYLTVQLPGAGKLTVKLFDNAGHMIRQEQFTDQNFVLDLKGITSGIYSIQINQNGSVYTKKFIKK